MRERDGPRGRRRVAAALAGVVLVQVAAAAPPPPRVELRPGGALMLTRLPPVLDLTAVARQVAGGLTTSFVFRVDVADAAGPRQVAARVDVRYELWDEVFHVATVGPAGPRREVLADRAALDAWWRRLELTVMTGGASPATSRPLARVRLEVLPFSEAERDETQRWFSQSLEGAGATAAEEVGASGESTVSLSHTLGLLMATSIERRAVASFDWKVTVATPAEGAP